MKKRFDRLFTGIKVKCDQKGNVIIPRGYSRLRGNCLLRENDVWYYCPPSFSRARWIKTVLYGWGIQVNKAQAHGQPRAIYIRKKK